MTSLAHNLKAVIRKKLSSCTNLQKLKGTNYSILLQMLMKLERATMCRSICEDVVERVVSAGA